jgi:hypothetical protein
MESLKLTTSLNVDYVYNKTNYFKEVKRTLPSTPCSISRNFICRTKPKPSFQLFEVATIMPFICVAVNQNCLT